MKPGFRKIVFLISLILVFTAVIGGLIITGGPTSQRKVLFDAERAKIIDKLSTGIEKYYIRHEKLPAYLPHLEKYQKNPEDYLDPVTNKMPDYEKIDENKFNLCMKFSTSNLSEHHSKNYSNYNYYYKKIKHPAGYYCVEYTIKGDPPRAIKTN